uniref:Uncharacterized protein n=1 Tax=Arundo donax TaxID=35708 RepID=A0A0A9BN78_ARUDO
MIRAQDFSCPKKITHAKKVAILIEHSDRNIKC